MKFYFVALIALISLVGVVSSCQNESFREVTPTPKEGGKVTVTYEAYIQEADGTISPMAMSLRAVTGDLKKATVTGDGVYNYNDPVTLKVTAKAPYTLYELYEKSEKGGFTKAKGKVDAKDKTLQFNVTDDMTFVAIFTNKDEAERGYRNLKVDNKSTDFTLALSSTKENYTQLLNATFLAIGEEVVAIKTADGTITGHSLLNGAFKAWEVVGPTPASNWLRVTFDKSTGQLVLVADPYNAKAQPRTTKVRIGKDATNPKLPSAWVEVTVKQSAFYTGVDEVNEQSEYVYGDGSVAGIQPKINVDYPPTGGVKDFTTLDKTLNQPVYVLIPTYKDGELLPKEQWVKEKVIVDFGNPNQSWVKKEGTNYSVPINNGKDTRATNVEVSFKIGKKVIAKTTVHITQKAKTYKVDVEIQ